MRRCTDRECLRSCDRYGYRPRLVWRVVRTRTASRAQQSFRERQCWIECADHYTLQRLFVFFECWTCPSAVERCFHFENVGITCSDELLGNEAIDESCYIIDRAVGS